MAAAAEGGGIRPPSNPPLPLASLPSFLSSLVSLLFLPPSHPVRLLLIFLFFPFPSFSLLPTPSSPSLISLRFPPPSPPSSLSLVHRASPCPEVAEGDNYRPPLRARGLWRRGGGTPDTGRGLFASTQWGGGPGEGSAWKKWRGRERRNCF